MGPLVVCLSYTAMTVWFRGRTLLVFKNVIHGWFVNKRWSYSTMMGLPSILVGLRECWAIDTGKLPIWKAPNYDFVCLSGTMASTFGIGKNLASASFLILEQMMLTQEEEQKRHPMVGRSHWIKATSFVTSSGQSTLCQQCQPIGISPQWTRCGHQEHQRLPHCLQRNQRQISAMVLEWGSWPSPGCFGIVASWLKSQKASKMLGKAWAGKGWQNHGANRGGEPSNVYRDQLRVIWYEWMQQQRVQAAGSLHLGKQPCVILFSFLSTSTTEHRGHSYGMGIPTEFPIWWSDHVSQHGFRREADPR